MEQNYFKIIPDVDGLDTSFIERLQTKRGWFTQNFYRCLPLTIANQMGYVILAPYNFHVEWNGGPNPKDVTIGIDHSSINEGGYEKALVSMSPSFGHGIVTFYPRFMVKTPPNINTLVKQPPNLRKQGVSWMEGMVETDNIMSTFSFNLKLTDANRKIHFKKGEPIACLLPFNRFFMDSFKLEISTDQEEIDLYRKKQAVFTEKRADTVNGIKRERNQYRMGVDFEGCPFHNEHQTKVTNLDK